MSDPSESRPSRKRAQPETQWLNATNPTQFKNPSYKRAVRSHAMKHYLSQKGPESPTSSPSRRSPSHEPAPPRVRSRSANSRTDRPLSIRVPSGSPHPVREVTPEDYASFPTTSRSTPQPSMEDPFFSLDWLSAEDLAHDFLSPLDPDPTSQYQPTTSPLKPFRPTKRASPVMNTLGGQSDWSPRSSNLIQHYFSCFHPTRSSEWLQTMLNHEVTRKSFVSVTALHKAAIKRDQVAITEYYTIRQEAIKAMRDGLDEAARNNHVGDDILVAVFMQTLMDVATNSYDGIMFHIQGFERMVAQRGGLRNSRLADEIAQTFVALVHLVGVVFEVPPAQSYLEYQPRDIDSYRLDSLQMLESPLYAYYSFQPQSPDLPHLTSLFNVPNCSTETYTRLRHLRKLTTQILSPARRIEPNTASAAFRVMMPASFRSYPPSSHRQQHQHQQQQNPSYSTYPMTTDYFTSDPSAPHFNSLPPDTSAIDDAVQLAGLIYTTALVRCEPISAAVDAAAAALGVPPATLLAQLTAAFAQTSYLEYWGSLAGVYVWVALVMAAASHHRVCLDAERPWARVQLCLPAAYSLALFTGGGSTADAAFAATRTMVMVQRRLGGRS